MARARRATTSDSQADPRQRLAAVQRISLLAQEELLFLFLQAKSLVGREGAIVDVGSFKGGSAICLALGIQAGGGSEPVYTIDAYRGDGDLAGDGWRAAGAARRAFRRNVARFALAERVVQIVADSTEVASTWCAPVKLLFHDGSVLREKVVEDMRAWSGFVVPGGLLMLHDYYDSDQPSYGGNVKKAVADFLRQAPDFRLVHRIAQTAVLRRG